MLTAFLSVVGLVIGAFLQHFFTRRIENQRHIRELGSKAYMDYLKIVCELAIYSPKEKAKERIDLMVKAADSKSRICLYGGRKAIHAFSRFEELGAKIDTEEQRLAFTEMVSAMRLDSGSETDVEARALQIVLLGVRN